MDQILNSDLTLVKFGESVSLISLVFTRLLNVEVSIRDSCKLRI